MNETYDYTPKWRAVDPGVAKVNSQNLRQKGRLCKIRLWSQFGGIAVGGVIILDLLPCNTTTNKDIYCEQINWLRIELAENLEKIIYHHDNAPAHCAKKTADKLKEAGWEIMVHQPYSPDLASSDYHLFTVLQRAYGNTEFESEEDVKSFLVNFIVSMPRDF